ncbi:ribosomal protein S18-alanine N-acetyltransferase [Candidatus Bathyarchaeota archaeon]|nr:ribosomal protein S18-alanine N-acetyltransferase [Candidatus Bathyarchaeota archaeon]
MIKMKLRVKSASVTDLQRLYEIEKECFSSEAFSMEQLAFLLENPSSISLIALADNEIVGFIIGIVHEGLKTENVGHVFTLDVAEKYRRKGIALRLLKELEKKFKEKNVKKSILEVKLDNEAAKKLYKKFGYKEILCLKDYYGKGVHGLRLRKVLK